jgi:pumilio RNA-binding family
MIFIWCKLIKYSFDQQGSRFLQEKLETATNEERGIIFREILPIAMNLIIDMSGNLVIQKVIDNYLVLFIFVCCLKPKEWF